MAFYNQLPPVHVTGFSHRTDLEKDVSPMRLSSKEVKKQRGKGGKVLEAPDSWRRWFEDVYIPLWFCCSIPSHQWFSVSTFKSPIDMKGNSFVWVEWTIFWDMYFIIYIYMCFYIHTYASRYVGMDSVRFLASKKKKNLQKLPVRGTFFTTAPGVAHAGRYTLIFQFPIKIGTFSLPVVIYLR